MQTIIKEVIVIRHPKKKEEEKKKQRKEKKRPLNTKVTAAQGGRAVEGAHRGTRHKARPRLPQHRPHVSGIKTMLQSLAGSSAINNGRNHGADSYHHAHARKYEEIYPLLFFAYFML